MIRKVRPGASGRLTVLRESRESADDGKADVIESRALFAALRSRQRRSYLFGWRAARLLTARLDVLTRPFASSLLVRAVSRGPAWLEDESGRHISITAGLLLRLGLRAALDWLSTPLLLRHVRQDVGRLSRSRPAPLTTGGAVVHLRTDLLFGLTSGGSVGHLAGVLNQLERVAGKPPVFLTTDLIPTVDESIETHLLNTGPRFREFPELLAIASNRAMLAQATSLVRRRSVAFVYQRYSADNYVGLALARRLRVPLVLEYNGSNVWVNRNWGTGPMHHEALAERIELLDLRAADLVVVVSDPLLEELVGRGVPADRVLVNPNGVDPDRYSPDADGSLVRERLGLGDRLVIGFIGTFGPWHGAEVLADAFVKLRDRDRGLPGQFRLLMIGDGATVQETRRRIERGGAAGATVFAGRTTQADGPAYLAACDILVSPHVPNSDGSRFFGSPTKLFEYMAMGKPIVASNLEQIGEVLEHDRTAWLVPPADADALADALRLLLDDPELRRRLGAAAREDAVRKHTWHEHTRRIVEALRERTA